MMPEWWQLLFILIVLCYLGVALFVVSGLKQSNRDEQVESAYNNTAAVTIIIPVRNEEENIHETLSALGELDYPVNLLEIIIADDGSTDKTPEIISRFNLASPRITHLRIDQRDNGLNGKANAIHNAIAVSSGEFVLVTDGDCRVQPNWIKGHLACYSDDVAMAGGFTLLTEEHKDAGLFARLQSLDWFFLTAVGSGMAKMGAPLSVFGTNFSFRRSDYNSAGGLSEIGFTLVEDFALMKAILEKTGKRVVLPIRSDMVVQSKPVKSLADFLSQRKRWVMGARNFSMAARLILLVGFAARAIPFFLIFAGLASWGLLVLGLCYAVDFLITSTAARQLRRTDQLGALWLYGLFQLGYQVLLLPQFLLGRSVSWKGRLYKRHGG